MTTHTVNVAGHIARLVNPGMADTDLLALAIAVSTANTEPETALEAIGDIITDNGVTAAGAERVASYLARILTVDESKLHRRPRKPFPALFRAKKSEVRSF